MNHQSSPRSTGIQEDVDPATNQMAMAVTHKKMSPVQTIQIPSDAMLQVSIDVLLHDAQFWPRILLAHPDYPCLLETLQKLPEYAEQGDAANRRKPQ